jgi:hypothetical protein
MPLVTLPAGVRMTPALLKQIMDQCGTCNPCGSGSGSGVPMPNGCAPCGCCPCICWWYTIWHKFITKDNLLVGPVLTPDWTLTSNTLTNVGGNPDYMYLGDIASDEFNCVIGGLSAIDNNGDIITDSDNPVYPRWEGQLTYTNGIDTIVYDIVVKLLIQISWDCATQTIADTVVWSGTTKTQVSGPSPGISDIFDYYILPNDIIGGSGTLTNCGGTFTFSGGVVNLPDFTLIPMFDPNCVP